MGEKYIFLLNVPSDLFVGCDRVDCLALLFECFLTSVFRSFDQYRGDGFRLIFINARVFTFVILTSTQHHG